jgi:hypothetical protein
LVGPVPAPRRTLIKGSTMHFEYICEACSSGLMRVGLDSGKSCTGSHAPPPPPPPPPPPGCSGEGGCLCWVAGWACARTCRRAGDLWRADLPDHRAIARAGGPHRYGCGGGITGHFMIENTLRFPYVSIIWRPHNPPPHPCHLRKYRASCYQGPCCLLFPARCYLCTWGGGR